MAFESNILLRQKLKAGDKTSNDMKQESETIIDDDMEYVTVFVSSENQMDADNEQIQLFEPVEIDEYSESVHEPIEYDEDITELEVADEEETNSNIDTTEYDKGERSIESDKDASLTIAKDTECSADESITTSVQGESDAQISPRKKRLRRNKGTTSKSFECDICGKVLSNHSSHKYHMQLHSSATPFLCSECGTGFKTRNAYDGHMVSHLPTNPNTCNICGNSYRQPASLRSHMLVHTGEKVHRRLLIRPNNAE